MNHLLITGTDDPTWHEGDNQSEGSSVPLGIRWLSPEHRTFLEVAIAWCLPGFFGQ